MSVTTSFQLGIRQLDSNNGDVLGNGGRVVTGSYVGAFGQYNEALSIPTSATPLTLPGSPVLQLYIKNLDSTNYITVTWTPNGGASNVVKKLYPGNSLFFFDTSASAGITALSLQANTAACLIEMFLAG